jgi:hypothetical protein
MSATTDPLLSSDSKRCPSCESDRPRDWFQRKAGPGSHSLMDTPTKNCKQCRVCFIRTAPEPSSTVTKDKLQEKKAAYIKRYRKNKAAVTKASEARTLPQDRLAADNSTPDLVGEPSTGTSMSAASAQKVDEKMQQSSKAIKLLDQDEIDAAADRLLDQLKSLQDSDDSEDEEEHRTCED